MKKLLLLTILPLMISCNGDKSNSKEGNEQDKNSTENSGEYFVYDGPHFEAPKCNEVEGIEIEWLNPNSVPSDYIGTVKICYPNGMLKYKFGVKNNKWDGDTFYYDEAGNLSIIDRYEDGLHVNSKMYRPDKTMYFQGIFTNEKRDGEHIQYGLKGEVKMVSQIKDRKIIACEGDDCP